MAATLILLAILSVAYSTRFRENLVIPKPGLGMAFVPGGVFRMGCPSFMGRRCPTDHWPHEVELSPYYIDIHEVTVRQYAGCVREGDCAWKLTLFRPADAPVGRIRWRDAEAFCVWAGKQLPTEAQWEKAARGTRDSEYPWGNEWDPSKANFCDGKDCDGSVDGYRHWSRPGSFPEGAGPYGVMDMAGNMLEWVRDWYSPRAYAESSRKDPLGPKSGSVKVVRGGSYAPPSMGTSQALRSWVRQSDPPQVRPQHMGFRCVMEPSAE